MSEPTAQTLDNLGIAVTGAAGDLGFAMSQELARRGAHVTMIDRVGEDEAAGRVAEVAALGTCTYIQADITDRAAVEAALSTIASLDVTISNAGIADPAPFLEITPEQWQAHLDVNLTGSFNVGQTAAQIMVQRGTPGLVLFTGSWVGDIPYPAIAAYSASKAGVKMLARSMARELAGAGIRANVVVPGIVFAGMARQAQEADPAYAETAAKIIPLGELGTAQQIAHAVAFLCSPDAAYMTGSVLQVDGGVSLFKFDD